MVWTCQFERASAEDVEYVLALEVRQQLQARDYEESREGDAVEDAHDGDEGEHNMGEEGGALLYKSQRKSLH